MSKDKNYYQLLGAIRDCSPEKTLEKAKQLYKKYGITRVANVTGLDQIGIYNAICVRPNSKSLSVSQGKGLTQINANVSAVMESIERWHAENLPKPELHGSYQTLSQSINLVNPVSLSDNYFDMSYINNLEVKWLKAHNLSNNSVAYVPYDYVSLDTTQSSLTGLLLGASSTGLASGNNYYEANCQALFEIIERHSHYLFEKTTSEEKKYNKIDLNSIQDPLNVNLINKFIGKNSSVSVWDMTSKLDIPAYYCIIQDNNPFTGLTYFSGKGCHFDKYIALSRALTEAAQSRLTIISGARDDLDDIFFDRQFTGDKYQNGKLAFEHRYFTYEANSKWIFNQLIKILNENSYSNIYCVNLTEETDIFSVVKIIIPQMHDVMRR